MKILKTDYYRGYIIVVDNILRIYIDNSESEKSDLKVELISGTQNKIFELRKEDFNFPSFLMKHILNTDESLFEINMVYELFLSEKPRDEDQDVVDKFKFVEELFKFIKDKSVLTEKMENTYLPKLKKEYFSLSKKEKNLKKDEIINALNDFADKLSCEIEDEDKAMSNGLSSYLDLVNKMFLNKKV